MILEIADLCASYRTLPVLADITLSVDEGEAVALLGANGAGKSSLLRCLSGLEPRRRSGSVRFHGVELRRGNSPDQVVRLGIAHVPEGRRMLGQMTVGENLELASAPHRSRSSSIRQDINQIFELFPILGERRRQLAYSLSGGEQQMLAVARALMARPHLILLDEPTLGLAPMVVDRVLAALEELRVDGMSLLIAEQSVSHALRVASRGYVIQQGKIVIEGGRDMLSSDPRVAAAFLGGHVGTQA
jgi:branched-chain amino acid transport system ATP-binding protein